MLRIFRLAVLFLVIASAEADEFRIARFDAQRVFDEYQHTKDLRSAIAGKINVDGPATDTPELGRQLKLEARVAELTSKTKAVPANSQERDRLELQLQLATLETQIDDLRRALESIRREQAQKESVQQQRRQLLEEISSAGSRICADRGYQALVPYRVPIEGPFPSIVVSSTGDDLTEALLERLNREYAAGKSK